MRHIFLEHNYNQSWHSLFITLDEYLSTIFSTLQHLGKHLSALKISVSGFLHSYRTIIFGPSRISIIDYDTFIIGQEKLLNYNWYSWHNGYVPSIYEAITDGSNNWLDFLYYDIYNYIPERLIASPLSNQAITYIGPHGQTDEELTRHTDTEFIIVFFQ